MFTATLRQILASSIAFAIFSSASPLESRQLPPADRYYVIANKCPTAINLYAGGLLQTSLARGTNTTVFATGFVPGPFWTDANGGSASGARSTQVGFSSRSFYYIVKDPNYINVAVSVAPRHASRQGLCVGISCATSICDQAFPSPPTTFPASETIHPSPPFYSCPTQEGESLTYDVTFCPDGNWPAQTEGADIHPSYNPGKCLDVQGANFANGTPVQVYDCNGTNAQRWVIQRGSTKVRVAGTNFCLDAGSNPANGIGLKIWQCYDNLAAQQWSYDRDLDWIRLEKQINGKSLCADLTSGVLTNGNRIQTWECAYQNTNQIWTIPFA